MSGCIRIDDDFTLNVYEDEEMEDDEAQGMLTQKLMEEIVDRIQVEHNYFAISPKSNTNLTQRNDEIDLLKLLKVPHDFEVENPQKISTTALSGRSAEVNVIENGTSKVINAKLISKTCDNMVEENFGSHTVFTIQIMKDTLKKKKLPLVPNNVVSSSSNATSILSPDSSLNNKIPEINIGKNKSIINEKQREKLRKTLEYILKSKDGLNQMEYTEPSLLILLKLANDNTKIQQNSNIAENSDKNDPNGFKSETEKSHKVKSLIKLALNRSNPENINKNNQSKGNSTHNTSKNFSSKITKISKTVIGKSFKFEAAVNKPETSKYLEPARCKNSISEVAEIVIPENTETSKTKHFKSKTSKNKTEKIKKTSKLEVANYPKVIIKKIFKSEVIKNENFKPTGNSKSETKENSKLKIKQISSKENKKDSKFISVKILKPGTAKQEYKIVKKKTLIGRNFPTSSSSSEFQNHPPEKMQLKNIDIEENYQPPKKKRRKTSKNSYVQKPKRHSEKVICFKFPPGSKQNIKKFTKNLSDTQLMKCENKQVLDRKANKILNQDFIVDDLGKYKFNSKSIVKTKIKTATSRSRVENIKVTKKTRDEILALIHSLKNDEMKNPQKFMKR